MTRYYEVLIERESISIDLSREECKTIPHHRLKGIAYDKFTVRFDYQLQRCDSSTEEIKMDWHLQELIKRQYANVIEIIILETPSMVEA